MSSSNQPRGHGRGRGHPRTQEPGLLSNDVSTIDIDISTTSDVQMVAQSQRTAGSGRGRGQRILSKKQVEVPDPYWTVSDLSMEQFKSNDRPSKPMELGTVGQLITVYVNYFPILQIPREGVAYQYDLEIRNKRNEEIRRRDHRRTVYKCWKHELCEKYPEINEYKIIFDNKKTIFTYNQRLPGIDENGITRTIMGPNRANLQVEYKISIKQVAGPIDLGVLRSIEELCRAVNDANISLDDLQSIRHMLSVALHENCSSKADFIFNRSFFTRPFPEDRYNNWDLGSGKAIWRGFYSCLIFSKGKHQLLMNLDLSHKVFMKNQPFLDFLCEVMLHSPCGKWYYHGRDRNAGKVTMDDVVEYFDQNKNSDYYNDEVEFLLKHCKGLFVRSQTASNRRGYIIHKLGKPASVQKFYWEQKKKDITVADYFTERYGEQLKYPTLPTLEMLDKSFVPMERIDVEAVNVKKVTDEQRAALCLKSSQEPIECYQSIKEIRHNPKQQCSEQDPFIAAWNLKVDVNMLSTSARILRMPDIICNRENRVTHEKCQRKGVWSNTQTPFYHPANFPDIWGIINLSSLDRKGCEAFYNELCAAATNRGMGCPAPVICQHYNTIGPTIEAIMNDLEQLMEDNNDCTFYIVILPEEKTIRDRIYGDIKKLCELKSNFGILTQMIQTNKRDNTFSWNYSKLDNILLKINSKLNGINSIIDVHNDIQQFFSRGHRIMYVGIDLSHAGPGANRRRSTVAVVASASDIPNRYFTEIYIQERPPDKKGESWETIVDLKPIMKSLINKYREKNNYPPKAIIIYRDGISTSEFDTVFQNELTATREACVELSTAYRPYLTYIVVNKRHHTRFFPTESGGNVSAGTVDDSHDVTNPTTYDFFLNSHYGQKGTSRPTHYHVLYDDNKLKPDQVQLLTYALCCLNARCTRSTSIPAPVKYADLLAYRAGRYRNINDESRKESPIPTNQEVNIPKTTTSERIVLSPNLPVDCPFFL